METATLKSPNISCEHCVMAIKKAVSGLEGVSNVEGNPDSKLVTVKFDPGTVSLDTIEATMAEEGYPVQK